MNTGTLASLDDFYMIKSPSSNLVVIETTNGIFNPDLYAKVIPQVASSI